MKRDVRRGIDGGLGMSPNRGREQYRNSDQYPFHDAPFSPDTREFSFDFHFKSRPDPDAPSDGFAAVMAIVPNG